ncbi:hypothetical protein Tco_1541826 [Tanacetum coccineum]
MSYREEQPLPVAASPTTESSRYIPESDPEEDPEEDGEETGGGALKLAADPSSCFSYSAAKYLMPLEAQTMDACDRSAKSRPIKNRDSLVEALKIEKILKIQNERASETIKDLLRNPAETRVYQSQGQ